MKTANYNENQVLFGGFGEGITMMGNAFDGWIVGRVTCKVATGQMTITGEHFADLGHASEYCRQVSNSVAIESSKG